VGGDAVVRLITPSLLEHFHSYVCNDEKKVAVRNGPKKESENFKYVANPPSIAVSGPGSAALITTQVYDNFELRVAFRWGEKVPRKDRKGAVLLRAGLPVSGPDKKEIPWPPPSVAVLLNEGDAGGIQLLGPPGKVEAMAQAKEFNNRLRFVGGEDLKRPLKAGEPAGWDGIIHRLRHPQLERNESDAHELFIVCFKGKVTANLNGQRVNEIVGLNLKKGHIIFTCEHADYTIGKAELTTLRE
jgi:hypothetical protein